MSSKRQTVFIFFIILALSFVVSGCGGSSYSEDMSVQTGQSIADMPELENHFEEVSSDGEEVTMGRKLVYNLDYTLLVPDPNRTVNEIMGQTNKFGGYMVESRLSSDNGESSHARLVVKIPQNNMEQMSAYLETLGTVKHQTMYTDDVTIEFQSQAKTVEAIQQVYYRVNENEKNMQLNRLLLKEQPESCLIFCNTRIAVERVQRFLWRKGYLCYALHGDIPQNKRTITLRRFKRGEFHIMIATDVAARGIHIDELSLVINYDVPLEKDGYVHRIGRTGRAGNQGRAITLVTSEDIMDLYEIEEHIGTMIPEGELPSEAEFNQYRAKATEWIERNSLKEQASNSTPKQGSKQKTNKSSDRYLQSGRRSKDSSKETYNKSKTGAGQTNRRPYAAPVEKDLRSNSPSPLTSANLETVPSSSDPISTNADNKTPAATKKKSWLKQLWQNIIKDQAKA
jgi:superfamily II DNA/RNA helicase